MRNEYTILVGKPEGKRPLEDKDVGGWIILKFILEIWGGEVWTGFIWHWTSEHRNKLSGSIKYWKILEKLHN
jgi:hypothetical protein